MHRIFDRSAEYPVVDVAGSRITLPVERQFASIDSVQRYVDRCWPCLGGLDMGPGGGAGGRERSGRARRTTNGSVRSWRCPSHRAGPAWALRELVILHELAHHLAPDIESAHGGPFVDRMLTLVDGIVGPEAALLLRVTMLDVGVRIG